MNAPTELSNVVTMPPQNAMVRVGGASMMLDDHVMDKMMRVAEVMATSRVTIPLHLQKSPGDCLAVVMQATQWGMNPFSVAQKTFLVGGVLGYEAQLVAAVINNSGAVKDRFHFEWFGPWEKIIGKFKMVESRDKKDEKGFPKKYMVPDWDLKDEAGLGIKVWATVKGETEPRELTLLMTQARTRNSTLWTEDPKQQIAYLAQKRWARLHTPDVILGVYTPDELDDQAPPRDMGQAEVVQTPEEALRAKHEKACREAAKNGWVAFGVAFNAIPKDERHLVRDVRAEVESSAKAFDAARTVETAPSTAAAQTAAKPATTNTATGEVTVTFEQMIQKLDKATSEDGLYVAMDWSSAMDDQSRISEVEEHFNKRLVAIRGE